MKLKIKYEDGIYSMKRGTVAVKPANLCLGKEMATPEVTFQLAISDHISEASAQIRAVSYEIEMEVPAEMEAIVVAMTPAL